MIRERVGPIYGAESIVFGSGNSFGGSPVSVSLAGSDIGELKAAKKELREAMRDNSRLADITDNDPAGIKEIKLKLKENAYLLGLTLNEVMSQVRAGFLGQVFKGFSVVAMKYVFGYATTAKTEAVFAI